MIITEKTQTKECYVCEETKVVSEFHKHSGTKSGFRHECKECRKIGRKKDKNPEYKKCSGCNKRLLNTFENFFKYKTKTGIQRARSLCKKCHYDNSENARIKSRYNLSRSEVNDALLSQNNKCSICRLEVKLFIDHCHKTGRFRAMLCDKCNRGIGLMQESVKNLENAILYLKHHHNNLKST